MANDRLKSAEFLLKQIQAKTLKPESLTRHQRKLCVRYFMDEHPQTTERQMGRVLELSHSTVSKMKKEILWQDGWLVEQLDYKSYASNLIRTTNTVITKLIQNAVALEGGSRPHPFYASAVWQKVSNVMNELTNQLLELGVLRRAPLEFKGQMTLLELLNRVRDQRARRLAEASAPSQSGQRQTETDLGLTDGRGDGASPI